MEEMNDRVTLGRIVKAVGLKGEVKLMPTDDFWINALKAESLELSGKYGEKQVGVEKHRRKKNAYILKLSGIDSIDQAEAVVGYKLELPLEEMDDSTSPDEIMPFQLMGLEVSYCDGSRMGEITDLLLGSSQRCIVVSLSDRDVPVPFVPELIERIDLNEGTLQLKKLPEGLTELKL